MVRKTSKNKKYCKECVKHNPYYIPLKTKKIVCIDCGIEFEVESKNTKTCRCENCQHENNKKIKRKYWENNH